MSKKLYIKRHILIINKVKKSPCSFLEIEECLENFTIENDEQYAISKRTFERDLVEIRTIYNIDIQYNRKLNKYEIINEDFDLNTLRIIESFEIYDFLSYSTLFSESVILEKRKPLATEYLQEILFAIKNNYEILIKYKKFGEQSEKASSRLIYPLALKEALFRWYLVAFDPVDGQIKTFGLERILEIQTLKTVFSNEKIPSISEKFKHSFGIITDGTKPIKIVLSFEPDEAYYIKTLPIHESQKTLKDSGNEFIVSLFLSPTYDFIMEILSLGKKVIVLEPDSLKEKIKSILQETLKKYQ